MGKRFKTLLRKELNKVKQNPFSRSVRYDDVRFTVVDIFPYTAHFTIDEANNTIIVQAVLAFKQDPDAYWIKRK